MNSQFNIYSSKINEFNKVIKKKKSIKSDYQYLKNCLENYNSDTDDENELNINQRIAIKEAELNKVNQEIEILKKENDLEHFRKIVNLKSYIKDIEYGKISLDKVINDFPDFTINQENYKKLLGNKEKFSSNLKKIICRFIQFEFDEYLDSLNQTNFMNDLKILNYLNKFRCQINSNKEKLLADYNKDIPIKKLTTIEYIFPWSKKNTELITNNNKNYLDKWEKYQSYVYGFKFKLEYNKCLEEQEYDHDPLLPDTDLV